MALTLSALTEAEIHAEESATRAGFLHVARVMRALFNRATTADLPAVVENNVSMAAACAVQPQRLVLPCEPIQPEPGDWYYERDAAGRWL